MQANPCHQLVGRCHPSSAITDGCPQPMTPETAGGDALVAVCYHDVMTRKPTTVRIPEALADTAEVVARARGVSVNALILEALQNEVDRVKKDKQFMALLRSHVERDKEILDRLAE
jgi:hypothetical protein